MTLVARRSRLDADLAARARWAGARTGVLHADGRRILSGFGELSVIGLERLSTLRERPASLLSELSGIELSGCDGPAVSAPRCHIAVPFDPSGETQALLPALQVTEAEGGSWLCVVGEDEAALGELEAGALSALREIAPPRIDEPVEVTSLVETPSALDYADEVAKAIEAISAGHLSKVVLARSVDLVTNPALDPAAVLQRMAEREPACTRYGFPLEGGGRLVGASPELLISKKGTAIKSLPLAGTMAITPDGLDPAVLLASAKDLDEHRLVVEDLARALRPLVESLSVPDGPTVVRLRSVAHLGTLLHGTVATGPGGPHPLSLLAALHPTPAVGGVGRSEAIELIEQLEGHRRNYFAGGLGWCTASGDAEWVLGIRGAALRADRCELSAGAGVVKSSTPLGEAEETRSKLASVLEAVAPGASALLAHLS